jgi:hypothetical protein
MYMNLTNQIHRQYLLNAEIYPLRIRAVSSSIVMCFHFVNQYGNSRAVPIMLLPSSQGGITAAGTFWCFTAITLVGGAWVWFFVPETSNRSLESMDKLFTQRWYQIGRFGEKAADAQQVVEDEKRDAMEHRDGAATQVERVPSNVIV